MTIDAFNNQVRRFLDLQISTRTDRLAMANSEDVDFSPWTPPNLDYDQKYSKMHINDAGFQKVSCPDLHIGINTPHPPFDISSFFCFLPYHTAFYCTLINSTVHRKSTNLVISSSLNL